MPIVVSTMCLQIRSNLRYIISNNNTHIGWPTAIPHIENTTYTFFEYICILLVTTADTLRPDFVMMNNAISEPKKKKRSPKKNIPFLYLYPHAMLTRTRFQHCTEERKKTSKHYTQTHTFAHKHIPVGRSCFRFSVIFIVFYNLRLRWLRFSLDWLLLMCFGC